MADKRESRLAVLVLPEEQHMIDELRPLLRDEWETHTIKKISQAEVLRRCLFIVHKQKVKQDD